MTVSRMSLLLRWVIAVALVSAAVAVLPGHARAADGIPSAPRGFTALEGSDGIRLSWEAPEDAAALTAYQLQRVATPVGHDPGSSNAPFVDIALLPASATSYFDLPVGGYYWSYRVLAVGAVGSAPSEIIQTRLGYPPLSGPTYNQVLVDGPTGTRAAGGVFIDAASGGSVTANRIDDRTFQVQAAPAPDSPDPRGFSFVIGSTPWGHRPDARTYRTTSLGSTDPAAALFRIEGADECGDRPGTLEVRRAEFLSDGTPLTFSASFTYCDAVKGEIRYNSTHVVSKAAVADRPALTFSTLSPQTVTFRNVGTQVLDHGSPLVLDVNGNPSTAYEVTADTCDPSPLAAGASCSVTAEPSTLDAPEARLVWSDGTAVGRREVDLSTGPSAPAPTVVRAERTLRGVDISWNRFDSAGDIANYRIYRGLTAGGLSLLTTVQGGSPGRFVDRTVALDKSYFYAVSAVNTVGEGPQSTPVGSGASVAGTLTSTTRWSGPDSDIALLNEAGVLERLTTADDNTDPTISHDGATWAYSSDRAATGSDRSIWVAGFGTAPRRLTAQAGARDVQPEISPDGRTIAFTRRTEGTSSLWLVPVLGGPATQIPGTVGDDSPTWAPSGRLIAAAHRQLGRSAIVQTNLNGSVRRTLTPADPNVDFLAPSWGPDNRYLSLILRDTTRSMVAIADSSTAGSYPNLASPYGIRVESQQWGPTGIVFEGRSATYSSNIALRGASVWRQQSPQGATAVEGSDAGSLASPASTGTGPAPTPRPPAGPPLVQPGAVGDGFVELRFSLFNNASVPDCYACPSWVIIRRGEAGAPAPKSVTDGIAVYEGKPRAVTVGGLANLKQYAFSLFAVSTVGDVSTPQTYLASPVPPPVIKPSASALPTLSGDGPNFTVAYGKPLPKEGFDYQVEVGTRTFDARTKSFTAPVFKRVYWGPLTSQVVKAQPGTAYYVRVRIVTWSSNPTAWSPVVAFAVPRDDRAFSAKGSWTALTKQKGRFLATLRQSSKAGSTLTVSAPGSLFVLLAERCPTCGKVQVYVDGVLKATVNTYAAKVGPRAQVWSLSLSTPGPHKVMVKVVGKGTKRLVRIDGLIVRP